MGNLAANGYLSPLDWPNDRLNYASEKGPLFDGDVQNALESLLYALNIILGLPQSGSTAFAILSGFVYSSGVYGPGIVYMNGNIYYSNGNVNVGQYLTPNITGVESQPFADTTPRNTYQVYYAVASNTEWESMPVFTSDMDSYRFSMNIINEALNSLSETVASLHPVPSGLIAMWSGSVGSIPSGWFLCDGTHSTPNLSGRFIVGYGSNGTNTYAVGDTGGNDNQTEVAAHEHYYPAGDTVSTVTDEYGVIKINPNSSNTDSSSTGEDAVDQRPAFYALAYIMKS